MSATLGSSSSFTQKARANHKGIGWLTEAYATLGMVVYQGAFTESFRFLRGDERLVGSQTELLSTISQFIILCGLAPALWPYRRYLRGAFYDLLPYIVVVALCTLSTLWSADPFATFRRSTTLSVCLLFGVWCYYRFGIEGTLKRLGSVTCFLGLCSIVVFFAIPKVGHEEAEAYTNAMRGVFSQKNTLGSAMLLAITVYLQQIVSKSNGRAWASFLIFFLLLCEVMAKSATSLLISFVVIGLTLFWKSQNNRRLIIVLLYLGLATLLVLVTALCFDPDGLFALFGRDPSLTGRVPLWIYATKAALHRPLLGYGYSGFWVETNVYLQYAWLSLGWKVPSAHNGYLDIMLQIGLIGLSVYMYMWSRVTYLAYKGRKDPALKMAFWILLFMTTNILLNLDEGPLPFPDQFSTLMPGAMLYLEAWNRQRSRGRQTVKSTFYTKDAQI